MPVTWVPEASEAGEFAERLLAGSDLLPALDDPTPVDFVNQVVERLKAAVDQHWSIDPHRSLEIADLIIAIGTRRGLRSTIALGTMARGDSLQFLGQTNEAWETLTRAGEMYLEAGEEFGWARTRIGRLVLSTRLNCVPEALADAERARAIMQRHGDPVRLIRLDWVTAYVYNSLGEPRRALELFRSTLRHAEGMGPAGEEYIGGLYLNIGTAHEALGELAEALDHYQRARELFAAKGESLHLATAEANIGLVAEVQGHYRQALQLLTGAVERVAEHSPHEATKIRWHILECYLSLSRHREARDLARQLVADNRGYNDAFELGRTLVYLATTAAELGNFGEARTALDEAEAIFDGLGAQAWQATVWLRRGRLALRLGEPAVAWAEARRALGQYKASGQQGNAVNAALLAGQAGLALAKPALALRMGKLALANARAFNLPSLRYSAHLLLGQASEAQQRPRGAARHYRAAAATTERVQRGLTITLRPNFLEDRSDALRRLIALCLHDNQAAAALVVLEQSKAQVLLGYLTNRQGMRWNRADAHSRNLIEELERLRAEHQWLYRLAHEPRPGGEHHTTMPPEQALLEVAARERRIRALTEQLYLRSANSTDALPPPSVALDTLHQALESDTLLIEYYDDGTRLWAFCLSRAALRVVALPITTATVNRLLEQLQMNIGAVLRLGADSPITRQLNQPARRIAERLHAGLVAPLGLQPDVWQRLIIVPYGALHYLPFNLLYDGARHLIQQHEIVVLPAAVLTQRPGPRQAPGARILAHSGEGQLPHTAAEAAMVQRLVGGEIHAEATRAALQAPPRQVLHVATHGHYRLDQPDLSYLQLADGQLYTDDLLQQDLSYELVTLSACETGRAEALGGELIGLGRGFLYAGAGALVLSLWAVADAATLNLMEHFYTALSAGQSKAAALREAQHTLLSDDPQRHPAYWAAFQLIGDARPLTRRVGG